MTDDPIPLGVFHDDDRRAIEALIEIYGDDVNQMLNVLHWLAARLAFAGGIDGKDYVAGVKYHWDRLAEAYNKRATQ